MNIYKIRSVRFVLDRDRHTVGYAEKCNNFADGLNKSMDGNIQARVSNNLINGVTLLAGDLCDQLKRRGILPSDFRFSVCCCKSDADGRMWAGSFQFEEGEHTPA